MRMIKTMLAGAAGVAALAAAAPASAQYYQSYGYSQPYALRAAYGYSAYGVNTAMAQQQCTAAVQSRLYNRTSMGSILGGLVGIPQNQGRVVGITSIHRVVMARSGCAASPAVAAMPIIATAPTASVLTVRLATIMPLRPTCRSSCDVDARGYVRNVNINRRKPDGN